MTTYKATRDRNRPAHPGEILREDVLPALNMPVQTAAKHLGVTRQTLHRILAEIACRFARNGVASRKVLRQWP